MIYLLLAALISFGLAWWLHKQTEKSADDWANELVGGLVFIVGGGLLLIYVGAVFWNHRFW